MKKTLTAITTMMMIGSFLTMTFGMAANASYKGDNEMVEYDPTNYISFLFQILFPYRKRIY